MPVQYVLHAVHAEPIATGARQEHCGPQAVCGFRQPPLQHIPGRLGQGRTAPLARLFPRRAGDWPLPLTKSSRFSPVISDSRNPVCTAVRMTCSDRAVPSSFRYPVPRKQGTHLVRCDEIDLLARVLLAWDGDHASLQDLFRHAASAVRRPRTERSNELPQAACCGCEQPHSAPCLPAPRGKPRPAAHRSARIAATDGCRSRRSCAKRRSLAEAQPDSAFDGLRARLRSPIHQTLNEESLQQEAKGWSSGS